MTGSLAVVGDPCDRRVRGFTDAAVKAGFVVSVVGWREFLGGAPAPEADVTRVDSPGGDPEVDRLLRGARTHTAPGEVAASAPWYRGLQTALARVERLGSRFVNEPGEIAALFDKRQTAARLRAAGVPAPRQSARDPGDLDGVAEAAHELGCRRVFVKPRYGSSGMAVFGLGFGTGRIHLDGNLSCDGERLWSSIAPYRTDDAAEVAAIVDAACRDAVVVEEWFPKAGFDGGTCDLRILLVAGEPRHAVVRISDGPVTNLNLGNRRGDVEAFRGRMGSAWEAVLDSCRNVAAAFPGCLYLGVDILVSPSFRNHAVVEVNAFGDLLPGVISRGQSTFEAEVAALPARAPW